MKNRFGYNPKIHHRRSIRLKGYDYSQAGFYFVTICVHHGRFLFGKIFDGKMILNDAGQLVHNEWLKLTDRFKNINLHAFVVMPNHFHAILEIVGSTLVVDPTIRKCNNGTAGSTLAGSTTRVDPTRVWTLGDMVGAFQSIVTVEYIRGVKNHGWHPFDGKLWQRNYYEIIIRNDRSYQYISAYIMNNPSKWDKDRLNLK